MVLFSGDRQRAVSLERRYPRRRVVQHELSEGRFELLENWEIVVLAAREQCPMLAPIIRRQREHIGARFPGANAPSPLLASISAFQRAWSAVSRSATAWLRPLLVSSVFRGPRFGPNKTKTGTTKP